MFRERNSFSEAVLGVDRFFVILLMKGFQPCQKHHQCYDIFDGIDSLLGSCTHVLAASSPYLMVTNLTYGSMRRRWVLSPSVLVEFRVIGLNEHCAFEMQQGWSTKEEEKSIMLLCKMMNDSFSTWCCHALLSNVTCPDAVTLASESIMLLSLVKRWWISGFEPFVLFVPLANMAFT